MIVNYTASGWELITQRAHGLLAAQLAANWKHHVRTERWIETLLAIAEHDDNRTEPADGDLLTPQGGPADFKMKAFDQRHCERTLDAAISKSRYIALLSSMHIDFVYGKLCEGNTAGGKMLKEQKELREKWRKELRISKSQLEKDYRLMEWCDALSLLICQRKTQPEGRAVEISQGPDNHVHSLTQDGPDILRVTPWPFEVDQFPIRFEVRTISQLTFKTSQEFRDVFQTAAVSEKIWTLKH